MWGIAAAVLVLVAVPSAAPATAPSGQPQTIEPPYDFASSLGERQTGTIGAVGAMTIAGGGQLIGTVGVTRSTKAGPIRAIAHIAPLGVAAGSTGWSVCITIYGSGLPNLVGGGMPVCTHGGLGGAADSTVTTNALAPADAPYDIRVTARRSDSGDGAAAVGVQVTSIIFIPA